MASAVADPAVSGEALSPMVSAATMQTPELRMPPERAVATGWEALPQRVPPERLGGGGGAHRGPNWGAAAAMDVGKRAQWGQRSFPQLSPMVTSVGGKSSLLMGTPFTGTNDLSSQLYAAMSSKGAGFVVQPGPQQLSEVANRAQSPLAPAKEQPQARTPGGGGNAYAGLAAGSGMVAAKGALRLRLSSSTGALPTSSLLCPSAAPTPRTPGATMPALSMGVATITLPSSGPANDAARVRSGGKALHPKDGKARLLRVASEPITLATPALMTDRLETKTPRRQRGMVRKVSQVSCGCPLSPQAASLTSTTASSSSGRAAGARAGSPDSAATRRDSGLAGSLPDQRDETPTAARTSSAPGLGSTAGLGSTTRSPAKRRVTFAIEDHKDEPPTKVQTSCSLEDGTPSPALRKSLKLLDGLYDLRRVVPPEIPCEDGQILPQVQDEAHDDLLHNTLSELNDTEEILRGLEVQLSNGQDLVGEVGGARHATSVVSLRALMVVKRKADLLRDVEARIKDFEEAQSRAESEILPALLANTAPPPPALSGIRKFIAKYTHFPGNPAEANKSVFMHFVSTFKLPSKHAALVHLRDLASMAGEWWAEACLSEAGKGMEHAALRRLFDVALGTGVPKDHPKLIRATVILNDRLALRVQKEANELNDKDEFAASKSPTPQVGPASKFADQIDTAVQKAVKEGVPAADQRLKEATAIAKRLREKDGERKRLAARQKRLDEAAAKKAREEKEKAEKSA